MLNDFEESHRQHIEREKLSALYEKQSSLLNLQWAESMWPLESNILADLPSELWPDEKDLQSLQYPWELLIVLREMAQKIIKSKKIDERAELGEMVSIEGPVWIDEGAKISAFAAIVGPTYIGKNAIIGHHVLVRHSIIEANSTIGAFSEIARSVIGREGMTHKVIIADNIHANNVMVGGQSITPNRRLDEQIIKSSINGVKIPTGLTRLGTIIGAHTRIGATCKIMPGVKIGKECILLPDSTVYEDLPDKTICTVNIHRSSKYKHIPF